MKLDTLNTFEIEMHGNVKYEVAISDYREDAELLVHVFKDSEIIAIVNDYLACHDRIYYQTLYMKSGYYEYEYDGIKSNINYEDDVDTILEELLVDILTEEYGG